MTRADRIREILAAWQRRRAAGLPADPDALCAQHPDLAAELRQRLQALDLVEQTYAESSTFHGPTPRRLGPYEIRREIGRGGTGIVYEAVEADTGRRVALKVLFPSVAKSSRALERFQREALAAGRLEQPGIVRVYAVSREDDAWTCAMELVEGVSLATLLHELRSREASPTAAEPAGTGGRTETHEEPGGPRDLARLFAGVADALQAAHDAGITHRDVKPANLILADEGVLKLADFGVSRLGDEAAGTTPLEGTLGTPVYRSPEQVRGRPDGVDRRTDVYSLGATLYEALTLRPPFRGGSQREIHEQILSLEPLRPRRRQERIPRDLETIVVKAMEKEPAQRYATAGDLARDLRAFADGVPIQARPVGAAQRFWRRVKRHKVLAAANVLLLAAVLTAFVLGPSASEEEARRRDAEYELLVGRAAEVVPLDDALGAAQGGLAATVLDRAISLEPERPEAYVARAFAAGRSPEERLADVQAAEQHGVDSRIAARLRAVVLHASGRPADAEAAEAGLATDTEEGDRKLTPLDELLLGLRANQQGEVDDARAHLTAAIDAAPPASLVAYLARRERASVLLRAGTLPDEALDDLLALRARGDRGPRTTLQIASLYRSLDQHDRAEALITEVLEQDLASPMQWAVFLEACQAAGELAWAERVGERAVEVWPDDGRLRALHGRTLARTGRLEEALTHQAEAARLSPDIGRVHALLALTQLDLHQTRPAVASAERAAELAPDDVWVRRIQAAVLLGAGRLEDAFAATDALLALAPEDVEAYQMQGRIRADQGRLEGAEAAFERAAALAPHAPDALFNLALVRLQRGRFDEAREAAEGALAVDPDFAKAHHLLGQLQSRAGEPDGAIASFRRAGELDVTQEPYRHDLARALLTAGRYAEARGVLDEAVRGFPGHPRPSTYLVLLLTTAPEAGPLDPERALALAREATSNGKGGVLPQIALALALYRSDLYLEALEALDVFDGMPDIDPAAYLVAALALHARGDAPRARARLAATEGRIDPDDPRPEADFARRLRREAETLLGSTADDR